MAELNRVQYSGGYIFGPASECYPQPVSMYGHFFSASYFSTFVPSNFSDQSIQTYPHHDQYLANRITQNSSVQPKSHCRFASDSYSVTSSVTEQQRRDSSPSTFRTSSQCSYTNDSPMSQLRLPKIKTSSNVAANVMMEEADLGYSSLSDYASLDNTHSVRLDELDISSGSDDVFDDVKSNFSDIIDDVIGTVHEDGQVNSEERHPNNETVIDTGALLNQQNIHSVYEPFIVGQLQHYDTTLIESSRDATTEKFLQRVRDRKHALKQDLECTYCNKMFNNKTNLTVHLRMHNNIRPHQCPYCEKSFTQKSTMRTHLRTHTGEKPYSCSHCARAFSDYSTYRKHQRVHTGEKPYSCDVCHKAFAQSGNMIRHKQTHFKNSDSQIVYV